MLLLVFFLYLLYSFGAKLMMNKESFRIHVLYLSLVIQEKFNKMFGISCWFMVFNATFSTIFQLFCGSQFYCGGNCRKPLTCHSHWQTLSHNVVSISPRHLQGSNSHTITTTTAPSISCVKF